MAISFAFEVQIGPVIGTRDFHEPVNTAGVQRLHIQQALLEIRLRSGSSCLPKQAFQIGVLELFAHVFFEMTEAIRVGDSGNKRSTPSMRPFCLSERKTTESAGLSGPMRCVV